MMTERREAQSSRHAAAMAARLNDVHSALPRVRREYLIDRTRTGLAPFHPAIYRFSIRSIEVVRTRSWHVDSDRIAIGISTSNGQLWTATSDLGTLGVGRYPFELSTEPVPVSDPGIGVCVGYLLVNSRHANADAVDKLLSKSIDELVSAGARAAASGTGSAVAANADADGPSIAGSGLGSAFAAELLGGEVAELLAAACDGPVAVERVVFQGIDLWSCTQTSAARFQRADHHRGIRCTNGCPGPSEYWVTWRVCRM